MAVYIGYTNKHTHAQADNRNFKVIFKSIYLAESERERERERERETETKRIKMKKKKIMCLLLFNI